MYSGNNIVLQEKYDGATLIETRFNIIFGGMVLGHIRKIYGTSENYEYFYLDNLGSRRVVLDNSGSVLDKFTYSAYGEVSHVSGSNGYLASYTGKEYDGTDLIYFNARYYDPVVGRFLTEDSIRDGLNYYNYCGNNPINYVDPDGHFWKEILDAAKSVVKAVVSFLSGGSGDRSDDDSGGGGSSGGSKSGSADADQEIEDFYIQMENNIDQAIINQSGELYISGENDCDIWARDVLKESGISESDNPIKNPEGSTVTMHKERLGVGSDTPNEGWNVHIRGGHMSLIKKDGDNYIVAHQGRNTGLPIPSGNGETTENYSRVFSYSSKEAYAKGWWGTGSFYSVE